MSSLAADNSDCLARAEDNGERIAAYAGYDALYKDGHILEVGCWAHVRRKFFDVDKVQPEGFAHEVLESITMLYSIEQQVKGQSTEGRRRLREARAGPFLETLKEH